MSVDMSIILRSLSEIIGAKKQILSILSKKSHFENLILGKIHIFKALFSQNTHLQSLVFHKIHIF